MSEQPVVLVVEDEPDVAESYELWLGEDHEVRVAEDGPTALEMVDDEVDVILLDRMMPGMGGDEVLATIRERGLDCRVAMVTAVDPDFDIVEMGFDDYVPKPPTREGLRETVAEILEREDHVDRVREYHALLSKRAALEAEKSDGEIAESEAFDDLEDRIDETEAELDAEDGRLLDDAAFVGELRDLVGEEDEHADALDEGGEQG